MGRSVTRKFLSYCRIRLLTMITLHYNGVIMSAMTSRITSHTTVYSSDYSGGDQRKHQSSASLAFVTGIHRWPVNSPHKGPVTRKTFSFDDVIMSGDIQNLPSEYGSATTWPFNLTKWSTGWSLSSNTRRNIWQRIGNGENTNQWFIFIKMTSYWARWRLKSPA